MTSRARSPSSPVLDQASNHALARILLQQGCSVVMADLRLLPEAETTLQDYHQPPNVKDKPSATFFQIDLADWTQLQKLFDTTLEKYGTVNILVNGAGIYEPRRAASGSLRGCPRPHRINLTAILASTRRTLSTPWHLSDCLKSPSITGSDIPMPR